MGSSAKWLVAVWCGLPALVGESRASGPAAVERNTDRRAARGFVPPSLRGAETASRTVWAYRGCRAAGSGELDQAVWDLRLVLAM